MNPQASILSELSDHELAKLRRVIARIAPHAGATSIDWDALVHALRTNALPAEDPTDALALIDATIDLRRLRERVEVDLRAEAKRPYGFEPWQLPSHFQVVAHTLYGTRPPRFLRRRTAEYIREKLGGNLDHILIPDPPRERLHRRKRRH